MNYLKITHNDIANGPGVRCVLWVAGCNHRCPGCQNPETWDPKAGKAFDQDAFDSIMDDMENHYKAGLTFSGGDPLFPDNRECVLKIAKHVKERYPNNQIWLYTGYLWEDIKHLDMMEYVDVVVDGPYVSSEHSIDLYWKGSANQRVIDVQNSLHTGKIVLWDENHAISNGETCI